jgi:zinc/manganese transport system permease protein
MLDLLETYQPTVKNLFLTVEEQQILAQSVGGAAQMHLEVEQLAARERNSRWQGAELTESELRRLSSYTLSFQEMEKGEQFVQRELRNLVRDRQRWVLGVPLIFLSLGWLIILGGSLRNREGCLKRKEQAS